MKIELKHRGSYSGRPAVYIEAVFSCNGHETDFEVTDNTGYVPEDMIEMLEDIVAELKEHNIKKETYEREKEV